MSFRIHALPLAPFRPLFALDDAGLAALGARRMTAEAPHSAPCRVSLADAEPGEPLILLNHRHLDDPASPYRSEGPIFIREAAAETSPARGEVPDMLARRLLSVRLYDADWTMTDAEVIEGAGLARLLEDWLARPGASVAHLHGARRGCFLAAARAA